MIRKIILAILCLVIILRCSGCQNNAAESFIAFQTSKGFGIGLNLAWIIFDGDIRKARKQNTNIAIQSRQVFR